jgi:hypothetical protein
MDVNRLRQNAERCFRLARAINDGEAERVLTELGREYAALAAAVEAATMCEGGG